MIVSNHQHHQSLCTSSPCVAHSAPAPHLPLLSAPSSPKVLNTSNRMWLRLVGRRHDVLSWSPDPRLLGQGQGFHISKHPQGNLAYGGSKLPASLAWVAASFEPVRRKFFNDVAFEIIGPPYPAGVGSAH